MKKIIFLLVIFFILFPSVVPAEEEEATVSGEGTITVKAVDGENESSKFMEYRDLPDGLTGNIELFFKSSKNYFLEFKSRNIALDDQYFKLSTGKYGIVRIDATYNKIPHRFAYDAKTLYSGIGSDNLTLSDFMQTDLQGSTSITNLASTLKQYFTEAYSFDTALFREKSSLDISVPAFDPFNMKFELNKEDRKGTRPYFGSFGFGNTDELMEPINYDTTDARFTAEYAKKPIYVSAGFYLSNFNNNIDTLSWDNPFRITDSTRSAYPGAYLHPYQLGPNYFKEGGSRGLIDLYPDNKYRNYFFSGSIQLPLHGRILANASWGTMEQDDHLQPYTMNTSLIGIADLNGDGTLEDFDAWDPTYLPEPKADAKVDTTLYNVLFTMKPANFFDIKARYRSYEYKNETKVIDFPGYARTDATWEEEEIANLPSSYKKSIYGIDLGFTFLKSNTVTVGYVRNDITRTNREVADSKDDIFKISFDSMPASWVDIRASYEMSEKTGEYDFMVPFGEEAEPPQLPWLRKYDEANRDRDRAQLLLTFYPSESLTLTTQVIDGKDDFKESLFGLLEDKHRIYSLDIDYALKESASVFVFASLEKYINSEKARQWDPDGGNGDPYLTDTTPESNSNWDGENQDKIRTIGAGVNITPTGEKNSLNCWYSMSKAEGKVILSSPVGGTTDANNFVPLNFLQVDNTKLQTFNVCMKHRLTKTLIFALGFMHERWNIVDFNYNGFTYIPTTATGAFNGALFMGTLEPKYSVNIGYMKLHFTF